MIKDALKDFECLSYIFKKMDNTRVFNMDCMKGMKEFPDKYFDLAIVDPPYGIGEDGSRTKGRTFRKDGSHRLSVDKRSGRKSLIFNTYKIGGWDIIPDEKYFEELFRISKNQIIWGANHIGINSPSSCWIVWDKINGENDFADCELAWTSFKSAVRLYRFMWNGMLQGSKSNGIMNEGDISKKEVRIHPTQKPVQLYKWLLKNYAKEGDKILDTHLGSQSSRIAAFDMGFDFTGYELDKDYFEAGNKRFAQHKAQLKLFA